jgi:predicted RNase H-like HicB family nuclease
MKMQLNEVKKLQKIAGIQINEMFGNSPEKVDRRLEDALDAWVKYHMDSEGNESEIRQKGINMVKDAIHVYLGGKIDSDDLENQFDDVMSKVNHLGEKYVIPKGDEIEDDEDPLYQEIANEIGEKKLQKLLMRGWELEDIAEDPQGAAASIK